MIRLLINISFLICPFWVYGQYYGAEKLNPAINTRDYDEISPKVSPDGKTLFFTRIGYPIYDKTLMINGINWGASPQYNTILKSIFHSLGGRHALNPEESDFNQDIWMAQHDAGLFDKIKHHGYPLNNALPNSVCSFSADGKAVYVINQFGYDGGMQPGFSISRLQGDLRWSFPSPLDISDFSTKASGLHMSMSEDESIVVMSLMRDDSFGGTDLYVSFKKAPGLYSVPINLGPDINSAYNEEAPFICSDNKTLYFSSDRPGIYGGKDIYKAVRLDLTWETWEEPYALYEPINSNKDDNQPFYHEGSSYMYFVSNRMASADIYRVNYYEILQEKDPDNTLYVEIDSVTSSETFTESSLVNLNPISITLVNAATGQAMDANINYISGEHQENLRSESGHASVKVNISDLFISINENGFLSQEIMIPRSQVISALDNNEDILIAMDPLVENGKIQTDPIFFLQSKSAIRKDSYYALDKLVKTLNQHWNVSIIIEGHTDDQGDEDALLKLSEERARAVKDYLVNKGISPLRIEPMGVGGTKPLNDNSTEALRRKNRRVEIVISKIFEKL